MRKEFGSQINARYGLFAASTMLRHADIKTTVSCYIEGKQRSVLGFVHLLKNERTIVPIESANIAVAVDSLGSVVGRRSALQSEP